MKKTVDTLSLGKLYNRAYDWILIYGPRIIIAIIALFVGLWLIRILKKWIFRELSHRHIDPSVCTFLQGVISIALQVILLLALMQILGIQLTIFTAVIGAFGVAAGLALSGTLQNFASGVLILLLKPYRVGDNIITQGQQGTVTSIQLFYTVILTFDNSTVIVPNSKLSNEIIVNLSRQGTRRLDIELKFSYGVDFNQVKDIIEKAIRDFAKINKVPEHRVGVSSLENDGFKVIINAWINAHGFEDTKLAFQQILMDDFKQSGIKLPGMA